MTTILDCEFWSSSIERLYVAMWSYPFPDGLEQTSSDQQCLIFVSLSFSPHSMKWKRTDFCTIWNSYFKFRSIGRNKSRKKTNKQRRCLKTTQWHTSSEEKPRPNFAHDDQTKQPKKSTRGSAWRNRPSTLTAKTICDLRQEVCAYSTALTKHTSQRCSKPSLSSPHFHSTGVRSGLLSASLTFFLFLFFRAVHLVPASVLTPAFALFLLFSFVPSSYVVFGSFSLKIRTCSRHPRKILSARVLSNKEIRSLAQC